MKKSIIAAAFALLFGAHFTMTPLFFCVLVLNCIIFAEIGFLAAMKINTYEEMAQVNTYILLPMSFLCGTFFSTQALPAAVRYFIALLPLIMRVYNVSPEAEKLAVTVTLIHGISSIFIWVPAFMVPGFLVRRATRSSRCSPVC